MIQTAIGKKLISASLCLLSLTGCATTTLPREERAHLGRLGVATAHYAPEMNFGIVSRGHATASGAALGAIAGPLAPIMASPYGIGVTIFFWPILAATGATVGAVGGLVSSHSGKEIEENVPKIEAYVYATEFQRLLSQQVVDFTQQRTLQELAQTGLKGSESPDHPKNYQTSTNLDTVLEVGLQQINLSDTGGFFSRQTALHVSGFSRLLRVADGRLLLEKDYLYHSVERDLEDWVADGGKALQEELQRAFSLIASDIVDTHFVEEVKLLIDSASLKQTLPVIERCLFCKDFLEPLDTLQPELAWQAFPAEEDLVHPEWARFKKAEDVVYDLQLYVDQRNSVSSSIDTHYGITQARYQFETPLDPCQTYNWRVRARFEVDGIVYVTPWKGYSPGAAMVMAFRTPCPKTPSPKTPSPMVETQSTDPSPR